MLFDTQHVTEGLKLAELDNFKVFRVLGVWCCFFSSNDSSEAAIEFPSLSTGSLIPNMSLWAQNWLNWLILGVLGFSGSGFFWFGSKPYLSPTLKSSAQLHAFYTKHGTLGPKLAKKNIFYSFQGFKVWLSFGFLSKTLMPQPSP